MTPTAIVVLRMARDTSHLTDLTIRLPIDRANPTAHEVEGASDTIVTVTMTVNAIAIATTIMMMTCVMIHATVKEHRLPVVETAITVTTMILETVITVVAQAPHRRTTRLMTITIMSVDTVRALEGRITPSSWTAYPVG